MSDDNRAPWTRELDERLAAFRVALLDDVRRMIEWTGVVSPTGQSIAKLVPPPEPTETTSADDRGGARAGATSRETGGTIPRCRCPCHHPFPYWSHPSGVCHRCPDSGPEKEAVPPEPCPELGTPAPQRETATGALSAEIAAVVQQWVANRTHLGSNTVASSEEALIKQIIALVKRERDQQHRDDYTAVSRTDPRDGETAIAYYRRALANLMAVPHGTGEP